MAQSLPNIIAWDYQFAPNAQKARNYLYATQTPFKICEQPFVIPRPILQNLGITYRRVPVLSIGKDVFPDNTTFIDAMQELLQPQGKGLKRGAFDRAFEQWGYRSFWIALPCLPAEFITPQLAKDREELFPVFAREDFGSLQNNGRSEFRAFLESAENDFLNNEGPCIGGGQEPALADIHAIWMIKWWIQTIGLSEDVGHGRKELPRIHRWIESLPKQADAQEDDMLFSAEEATKQILGDKYALPDIGVDTSDVLGLQANDAVVVEAGDAKPGNCPQHGKLVGLNKVKFVIELENGLRVHFPKVGYFIKKAGGQSNGHS
nr:hypothetical protein B0A51_03704 [Rachicladosporium sp. CCFEE 5018]